VLAAYEHYEFHVVYQKVSQFVAVELSAIYHDVVKDRMYTDAANSHRRRSTQTALHALVSGLCKMLSPILVFTADEAWEFVPGKAGTSVHEAEMKASEFSVADSEKVAWESYFKIRELVLPELEKARQAKTIGKSLEAKVTLTPDASVPAAALSGGAELKELLNVSQFNAAAGDKLGIKVEHADGQKCERCWHWEMDTGANAEHPTLCARCVDAVKQAT
jgi:isoleucyl-tRNA synthetase